MDPYPTPNFTKGRTVHVTTLMCYNKAAATAGAAPLHDTERTDLPMQPQSTTPPTDLVQCACGCGQEFPKYDRYHHQRRYIFGHHRRGQHFSPEVSARRSAAFSGAGNANWRGGRAATQKGYMRLRMPEHPAAQVGGWVHEHRLVMETVLGRYLDPAEIVHHIDGDRLNNSPANLCLIESNAAHVLLHNGERCRDSSGRFA